MIRGALSKVMWVGRATVFVVGLAVILAMVVGLASTALATNGQNFIIGNGLADTVKNFATSPTKLTMQGTATGPALQVTQKSTNTGAQGLGVTVPSGKVPITVNSTAGKATNLNADKLDGKDSSAFVPASRASMWAVVNENGDVIRSSPAVPGSIGVVAGRDGTGNYVVRFDGATIDNCAYTATTTNGFAGQTGVNNINGNIDAVQVFTTNSAGTPTDFPFHLIVAC